LFAADGKMLHCQTKSNLMAFLEGLTKSSNGLDGDTGMTTIHVLREMACHKFLQTKPESTDRGNI